MFDNSRAFLGTQVQTSWQNGSFLQTEIGKFIKINSKNIFLLKPILYLLTPSFGSLSIGLF